MRFECRVYVEERPQEFGLHPLTCPWDILIEFNHTLDPSEVEEFKDSILAHCQVADVNEDGPSGLLITPIRFIHTFEGVSQIAYQVCDNLGYEVVSLGSSPYPVLPEEISRALLTQRPPIPVDCTQN